MPHETLIAWVHDSYVMYLLGYIIISIVNCNWNDAEYSTLIKLALYSLTAAVQ